MKSATSSCTFPGCDRPHSALGLCEGHRSQTRRGRELAPLGAARKPAPGVTAAERLEACTDRSGECWLWTGSVKPDGYGQIGVDGRVVSAHRLSYELACGPVPKGMMLDHTCHTPLCIRPEHLRPVTNKQNAENRRGAAAHSRSGVRGVNWDSRRQKWCARARHNGRDYRGGYFITIEEAEAAAIALRNSLFTHNDLDRAAA